MWISCLLSLFREFVNLYGTPQRSGMAVTCERSDGTLLCAKSIHNVEIHQKYVINYEDQISYLMSPNYFSDSAYQ
jgi:hypothetical protein